METMLRIVQVGALALAFGLTGLAWYLVRRNRRRTAARAEMLRQLALEPAAGHGVTFQEPAPLALLSLSDRTEAEDFVVAGLVQNPPDGRPVPKVMAVVYVFNTRGEYFASGRAALEFAPLAPGAESPFEVRLPKITGVTRFRIGFRAPDGSVVAHIDRRGQPIEGTTPATVPEAGGR